MHVVLSKWQITTHLGCGACIRESDTVRHVCVWHSSRAASCECYFIAANAADIISAADRTELLEMFHDAFDAASAKLDKYIEGGQPGVNFLKACKIFDPAKVCILPEEQNTYHSIPGCNMIPELEFDMYTKKAFRRCISISKVAYLPTDTWWKTHREIRVLGCSAVLTNSADAERSFSLYNLLVDARRRQLTENNIKALMFLYYNLNQFDSD